MRTSIQASTILTTLVLSLEVLYPVGLPPSIYSVNASSQTIALVGAYTGWNASTVSNPGITVTQGETVTVELTSVDTTHQFFVDANRNGMADCPNPPSASPDKCSAYFGPSSPTRFSFTAGFAAGSYTYYCSIHIQSMRGSFIVQPSSTGAPDFSSTIDPSSLNLAQGSTGSATITLTSLNGFSGDVALTASVSAGGPQVSLNPMTLSVPASGSGSSTLTLATTYPGVYSTTTTAPGTYTVTITETSGSISHTTIVSLTVGSTSGASSSGSGSNVGGPSTAVVLAVIAAIAVSVGLASLAVLRQRRRR